MKLTILGPNLVDQSKGSFHVHAAGCADLKKRQYANQYEQETGEWASHQAIVEDYYGPQMDEGGYPWTDIADDFYLFPCTAGLPYETPAQ